MCMWPYSEPDTPVMAMAPPLEVATRWAIICSVVSRPPYQYRPAGEGGRDGGANRQPARPAARAVRRQGLAGRLVGWGFAQRHQKVNPSEKCRRTLCTALP